MRVVREKVYVLVKPWAANLISLFGGIFFSIQLWYHTHFQYSPLDEGVYALKGYLFATGKYFPYQEYGPWTNHMPLSFLIPGYIQILFGSGLRTVRYFSVILALLGVFGIWITARRLGGKWWATASIWIVALNPSWAKFYSLSTSQVIVYFMLAWVLVLVIGKNLPTWRLVSGSILASIMFLTRINMVPVLVILLGYSYWQYGWRKGIYATLTSLLSLILGIILFSPRVIEYMLYRTPVKDIHPSVFIIIFLAVFVGILFWKIKPSFISKQFIKYIISFGILGLFVFVFSSVNIISVEKQFRKTIFIVVNHLVLILGCLLVYYLLRKGVKKIEYSHIGDYIQSNKIKTYIFLIFLESIGVLVSLFIIPSDPKNAWLHRYSIYRIGMMVGSLIFLITVLWFTIKSWRDEEFINSIQRKLKSRFQTDLFYSGVFYLSIIFILINLFVALQVFVIKDMAILPIIIRLMPFIIFGVILGVQTLYLISLGTEFLTSIHGFLFNVFSTLFATLLILHILQYIFPSNEFRYIFAGIRSHFVPILGLLSVLVFWKGRQNWKSEESYKIGLTLTWLFVVLILIHLYAVFGLDYCSVCFQPYLAFFSQLGIFLLIISFENMDKSITKGLQFLFIFLVLLLFAGIGYILSSHASYTLLTLAFLVVSILSGIKLIFSRKQVFLKNSLSAFIAITCIGVGILFSITPLLGGGYQDLDCNVDIIEFYESFGSKLKSIIPEGTQIFWWGSSPVPLLYLPERNIYPAQLNKYHVGGDTEQLLRTGQWNDIIGKQWVYETDFIIVKDTINEDWFIKVIEEEFESVLNSSIMGSCEQREVEYTVYQKKSQP